MPLYEVARFFISGIQKDAINEKAASISFNFFLAIFPGIIFLFTLISYIPIENFHDVVMITLKEIMPEKTYEVTATTIEDILKRQRGGLLSFGFLFALYFSTRGMTSVIGAFNNTYYTVETRNWLTQRLISSLLLLIQTLLLVFAVALIISSQLTTSYLVKHGVFQSKFIYFAFGFLEWLIIIGIYFLGISFIYYLAPAKKTGYRFISAGSTLATALSVLTTFGFNYYIDNFSRYNILYGSIGTLILIMLWMYFHALILLIGFELNASIHTARRKNTPKEG